MEMTLASLLRSDSVPLDTLHAQYGALLELVEKLIGVVPNCDSYLEIWPPAFRTYNVLVPNFLNLPFSLWGVGAPKDVVGLSMYVASRTAGCAYCSAHTSSFALRRGARPEKVAHALDEGSADPTPAERASIAVGRSMASIPAAVTAGEREELVRQLGAAQAEWIVLGVAMMGFLNKFMDAIGVELEGSTMDEVRALIAPSGWSPGKHADPAAARTSTAPPRPDSLATKLGVLPLIPAALSHDCRWTAGVPKRWPDVGAYLREHVGHDFALLSRLTHARAIRAIGVMLRDNLDPDATTLGLPLKHLAGLVFATVVADAPLAADMRQLAARSRLAPADLDLAVQFAKGAAPPPPTLDARAQAALLLARAASPSPAVIPAEVIDACTASGLPAAAIVELVTWLSVLQMMHRLAAFYPA